MCWNDNFTMTNCFKNNNDKEIPVITIDGPTCSGKGTIGCLLAVKLGWNFLDSGVLYRALSCAMQKSKLDECDINPEKLEQLISHLKVKFNLHQEGLQRNAVLFDKEDISFEIRSEFCSTITSKIASNPIVREALLGWQKKFHHTPGLVADGRDMGTVVFPYANLKIFLTATPKKRAQRRYEQLKNQGINVSLREVLKDLVERDERDSKRLIAPLIPAAGSICIDTTDLTVEEVLDNIIKVVGKMCI